MTCTKEDLDYVLAYARMRGRAPSTPEEVAQLVAEARREERERCADRLEDLVYFEDEDGETDCYTNISIPDALALIHSLRSGG